LSDRSVVDPSMQNLEKIRIRAAAIANYLAGRPGCTLNGRTDDLGPEADARC
jgi:hypothetical protein